MLKTKLLLAFPLLLGAACGAAIQNAPSKSNGISANAASTNANFVASPSVKIGRGVGIIVSVDPDKSIVELNHEEIKGMMPAMQMMFNVADKTALANLKPGDKVEFTLEENANREERITQIRLSK